VGGVARRSRDLPIHLLSRLLAPRHEPELQRGIEHGPDLGIDIGF
jgi:hypothetical protein